MLDAEIGKAHKRAQDQLSRNCWKEKAFPPPSMTRSYNGMMAKDVSIPGAPFEIERIWIEDGRLFYTRQGDSLVATGPSKPGVKALIAALQEILRALK